MKRWLLKHSLGQAFGLSLIQALGWFYTYMVTSRIFFQTILQNTLGASQDFYLNSVILGFMVSIFWVWLVSRVVCWLWLGAHSWPGFVCSIFLALPMWAVLWYLIGLVMPKGLVPPLQSAFRGCFYILTLFGLLSEGRPGEADLVAWWFFALLLFGWLGYYMTTRRLKSSASTASAIFFIMFIIGVLYAPIHAYPEPVHANFLTGEAAALLNNGKMYEEIFSQRSNIQVGTIDEDQGAINFPINPFPKAAQHFYRPTDQQGLTILGISFDSAQQRLFSEGFFGKALEAYKQGQKIEAYKQLGHALHLAAQDMFSPPHTNLDVHIVLPVFGGIQLSPNGYESWIANNFSQIAGDPRRTGQIAQPVSGAPTATLHESAVLTYKASRIPGALHLFLPDPPASGAIAPMFPSIQRNLILTIFGPEVVWTIPNVGDCREFTGFQANPGLSDNWWKAKNLADDPPGADFFYIENSASAFPAVYKDGSATGGKSLAELWALEKEKLLAKSQEFSAGLMKQFALLVDPIKPEIEIEDSLGNPISLGGFTRSNAITVKATDPTDTEHQTASGIYRIVVKNLGTGVEQSFAFAGSPDGVTGPHIATHPFVLPEGNYQVSAFDGLGNTSDFLFGIDSTSPTLTFTPDVGPSQTLDINSSDSGAGLLFTHALHIQNGAVVDEIVTTISGSPKPAQQLFAENLTTFSIVAAQAMDAAGNIERKNWLGDSGLAISDDLKAFIAGLQDKKIDELFVEIDLCKARPGEIISVPVGANLIIKAFCPEKNIPPIPPVLPPGTTTQPPLPPPTTSPILASCTDCTKAPTIDVVEFAPSAVEAVKTKIDNTSPCADDESDDVEKLGSLKFEFFISSAQCASSLGLLIDVHEIQSPDTVSESKFKREPLGVRVKGSVTNLGEGKGKLLILAGNGCGNQIKTLPIIIGRKTTAKTAQGDCGHPDEHSGSSQVGAQTILAEEAPGPSIGMFMDGHIAGAFSLLAGSLHEKVLFVEPGQTIPSPMEMPALIIPSGGLAPYDGVPSIQKALSDYVSQGGTILCFSQPNGEDFKTLPRGNEIEGFGWQQDVQWAVGAYIPEAHPLLSSISNQKPAIGMDGYFTQVPQGAEVLLRRLSNGFPALIKYAHGSGSVIAGHFYEDWGVLNGQSTPEGRILFADLLSFAKSKNKNILTTPPSSVTIINRSTHSAHFAFVYYLSPQREVVSSEAIPLSPPLLPGGSLALSVPAPPSGFGIHALTTRLTDDFFFAVQKDETHFVLANPAPIVIDQNVFTSSSSLSAHEVLQELDDAKTLPQWEKARERLKTLGRESHTALRTYIKDTKKDGRKRFMALQAICQNLSQGQTEEELLKAFKEDSDPYFRLSCAMEMGKTKSAHCQQALRKAISDPKEDSFVQVASALGLAKMGDDYGKERALKAILNAEPVASFGIEALATLKATEVISALQKTVASSKDYFVRNNSRLAILRIEMAGKSQPEQAKLLREALLEDGYFHVRKWAGIHLGERGDEFARALLLEIVKDPRAPPGQDAAHTGLLIGIEKGHWTRKDIQRWLRP